MTSPYLNRRPRTLREIEQLVDRAHALGWFLAPDREVWVHQDRPHVAYRTAADVVKHEDAP